MALHQSVDSSSCNMMDSQWLFAPGSKVSPPFAPPLPSPPSWHPHRARDRFLIHWSSPETTADHEPEPAGKASEARLKERPSLGRRE